MEFLNAVEILGEVVNPQKGQNKWKQFLCHLFQIGIQKDKGFQNRSEWTNHPEAQYFWSTVHNLKQKILILAQPFPPTHGYYFNLTQYFEKREVDLVVVPLELWLLLPMLPDLLYNRLV